MNIADRQIQYIVTRGKSTKYIYFRFTPEMMLEVVVPRGRAIDLDSAIKGKTKWILRRYEESLSERQILKEDRLMYEGAYLTLVFKRSLEREEIRHDVGSPEVVVQAGERQRIRELVRRWFIRETSRYVMRVLGTFPQHLRSKCRRVDVREIRNWGYCTRDGRIAFNWQLIALPEKLREYVVLHELIHLSVFSHSPTFKKRLEAICPDFRQREAELRRITPVSLID